MKIALLSDLHANLEALQACLRHSRREGAQQWAFLGDIVGYGADPGAVVDIVAEHAGQGAILVQGNHDEAVEQLDNTLGSDARAAIEWTRQHLSAKHAAFLGALPRIVRRDDVCYVHASADEPAQWTYVNDTRLASRSLAATDCTWCFSGHVHDQLLFYQGSGSQLMAFRPARGVPIPVGRHRRWLGLVGSTGQPRDGNPAAAYALFDAKIMQLVFHRVPYDHATAAAKVRAAGLPEALAAALESGN